MADTATEYYLDGSGVTDLTGEYDARYAALAHSHELQAMGGRASASQMPEGWVPAYAMSAADFAALGSSDRVAGALYYTWEA